jgi:hypothetical protein
MALRRPARQIRSILTAAEHPHAVLRSRLVDALALSLVVDAIASVLAYFAERHAKGTAIHTFGDAVFWTTAQLTTISSQMANPLSTAGRILDILIEIYAIVVITAIAGAFASFMTHTARERADHSSTDG